MPKPVRARNQVHAREQPYRITVVTVVLNDREGLRRTLESILAQTYSAIEAVVIDGGSTDGSVAILQQYANRLSDWVSEPDSGIAEAMNKGLMRAGGDLVLFLHADDRLLDDTALERAMTWLTDLDRIWAFEILFGEGGDQIRVTPRPFNFWVWFKNPLPHQGVLCPRRLFERLGGFDQSLKIDMDYDFWLRAYGRGIKLRRVPVILAVMNASGVSSRRDWPGLVARFREERQVQMRYARHKPWRWIYLVYWPVYLLYRKLRCVLGVS